MRLLKQKPQDLLEAFVLLKLSATNFLQLACCDASKNFHRS